MITAPSQSGIARADARPHRPWPRWRIVLAYGLLATAAAGAIWLVDRKVHHPPGAPRTTLPAVSSV
jgi:hypothetical protein